MRSKPLRASDSVSSSVSSTSGATSAVLKSSSTSSTRFSASSSTSLSTPSSGSSTASVSIPKDVILRLSDVWKIYKMGEVEVPALRGVSLDIKKGDFVAIIGASGSGKSTLMNLIGCLDTPSKGAVYLKGRDIGHLHESDLASFRGRAIGFIFQQYNLIPSLSAYANVVLPMEFLEFDDVVAARRAREILTLVGLGSKMHHRPSQLSGGQQQRVSIARSLASNPEIILADEPTGALDSVTGKEVLSMLHKLWAEQGKTIIMVTHDLGLAKYARTQVELSDGKILKITHNPEVLK